MRNRIQALRVRRPSQQLGGRHWPSLLRGLQVAYNLANVNDSGPAKLHLTNDGGVTFVPGRFGLAASISNSLSRATHPALAFSTAPWTVAIWARPAESATGIPHLIAKWVVAGNQRGLTVRWSSVTTLLTVAYSGNGLSGAGLTFAGTLLPAVWTHVILDYDGTNFGLRFNGGSREAQAGDLPFNNTAPFEIGALGGGSAWNGLVDGCYKWNRLLSDLEVAQLQTREYPFR